MAPLKGNWISIAQIMKMQALILQEEEAMAARSIAGAGASSSV